ncbi:MAG: GTP-binding protein, partial [Pseudomonadota bacterium]
AYRDGAGTVLGLTGPPGVGKSTLIDALIRQARGAGQSIAVIAVDPSSRRSGGALLGDRTRLTTDPEDQGVFVRSMAARDRLGGVADVTFPASVLMRAVFDLVIVETVGVGQSETQIADIADCVAFCAQPGSGDALQYMKAGVMEIPDLVLVTKGDLGQLADRTLADLKGALSLTAPGDVPPEILRVSAQTGLGLDETFAWIAAQATQPGAVRADRRRAQAHLWGSRQVRERFGSAGLSLLEQSGPRLDPAVPFASAAICAAWLTARLFGDIQAD